MALPFPLKSSVCIALFLVTTLLTARQNILYAASQKNEPAEASVPPGEVIETPPLSHTDLTLDEFEKMRKDEKERLQNKINQNRIKIEELQVSLETHHEEIEKKERQKHSILSEIEDLDNRLNEMGQKYAEQQAEVEQQQQHLEELESRLTETKQKSDAALSHMKQRIAAFYKLGKIDLINITFSSKSFPELLRFNDSFQSVIAYDHRIMSEYRATIDSLEENRRSITLGKSLLEELRKATETKEEEIKKTREEKKELLAQINDEKELHEQAVSEAQKATSQLAYRLLSLQKKEEMFDQGFYLNKGRHIAPVKGTVIHLFNETTVNQFGISRKLSGIAIDAIDGSRIRAIFDGKVIFSGYLQGYGNAIIIDHGYNYYTVTSRIETLIGQKGAEVRKGDIIGIMGSTATITERGLYFEIRFKDTPLDPLQWLDPGKLSFADGTLGNVGNVGNVGKDGKNPKPKDSESLSQ